MRRYPPLFCVRFTESEVDAMTVAQLRRVASSWCLLVGRGHRRLELVHMLKRHARDLAEAERIRKES